MSHVLAEFRFPADGDIRKDLAVKFPDLGDMGEIYAGNQGAAVHKWHHYLPLYERYFSPWRNKPLRFLEIGVFKGGSMQMWRQFFGPEATIYGIDINPACAALDGEAGQVRIGSQADPEFLNRVIDEMGGVDVILDDGSHHMDHIEVTLDILFPRLSQGGIYMIEDLHTAYWPRWGGGLKAKRNFFNVMRELMDDMHAWYHKNPRRRPDVGHLISGLHVHDSIVVLDKMPVYRPVHSGVGGAAGRRTDAGALVTPKYKQVNL